MGAKQEVFSQPLDCRMVTADPSEGHRLLRLMPDEERRIDNSVSYGAVMLKNCSLKKPYTHAHTHMLFHDHMFGKNLCA